MDSRSIAVHAQRLAEVVRRQREARNQSLGDLARSTGLSKTSLARIEAGEGNPSLETLWRLGHAMGLSIGQLIEQPAPALSRVQRAHEGSIVESSKGMRGRLLETDRSHHRTEVFELDLPEGARFESDPHDAGTREVVHCVQGSVACGPAEQLVELEPGDTAYFDGTVTHVYAAGPGGGRAVLIMSYPPDSA
ncbi:helix-turn-helix domain-containing protein [Amycolatopsis magusensis]|uniref:helix-turn-helix domain-containing protein n=1 Tax=Amycolatopsis magusensis TaxID=882444 RepID=UPI0024A90C5B|nr:XRE family transcriptional regulator [Amycolatopsis magusensis]MDI5974602.1 XRE family transcriptional regulator [Amycolatopsis magusensis]